MWRKAKSESEGSENDRPDLRSDSDNPTSTLNQINIFKSAGITKRQESNFESNNRLEGNSEM